MESWRWIPTELVSGLVPNLEDNTLWATGLIALLCMLASDAFVSLLDVSRACFALGIMSVAARHTALMLGSQQALGAAGAVKTSALHSRGLGTARHPALLKALRQHCHVRAPRPAGTNS